MQVELRGNVVGALSLSFLFTFGLLFCKMDRHRQHNPSRRNPCLTLHQPWASLLVHGIKRIEGRSWPSPIRGRLWIHAAAKVPQPETIQAMENFYRELYSIDGVTDVTFPEHYPVSVLLGTVNIVGCLTQEELSSWDDLPNGVRLEGQTDFCWLCEDPQKLVVPFEMRGWQGVYNLENKIADAAERGLQPARAPTVVKFPLPDPSDPGSLQPGSITAMFVQSKGKMSSLSVSPSLCLSIEGAQAAATQFRKDQPQMRPSSGSKTVASSFTSRNQSQLQWERK
eukprot:c24050_g1_i1 orf=22-867(+)